MFVCSANIEDLYLLMFVLCIEQQQLESRINQLISDKNEMHIQLQDCEEKIKSQNECENYYYSWVQ